MTLSLPASKMILVALLWGIAYLTWRIPRRQAVGPYTVKVVNMIHGSFLYPEGTVTTASFTIQ